MLFRRVAGVVAGVLLIPQLLGARDVACPRHGESHPMTAAATHSMPGHTHHQAPAPDRAPAEHHPVPGCCPAMSSCTGGTAIQTSADAWTPARGPNDAPLEVVAIARSRVESPDPPPPKA